MKTKLHFMGKALPLMLSFIVFCSTFAEAGPRPDITSFTAAQQQQLADLIMSYICTGQPEFGNISPADHHFNEVCEAHTFACSDKVECNGTLVNTNFLPWHREFIGHLETFLLENGGEMFVPLPEWDPCTTIPPAFTGQSSTCGNLAPPTNTNPNCGAFGTDKYSCENLCGYDEFCEFSIDLELDHGGIHARVGGAMANPGISAGTAIFYLWHAFVDDVWYDYQVANMTDDLPLQIEAVETSACGTNHYRVQAVECLENVTWTVSGTSVEVISQTQSNGFFGFKFKFVDGSGGCSFNVSAELTSSCANTKTIHLAAKTPPCVEAVLTDKNGEPTDMVCFGEDIYLDASGSKKYNEYFISIWESDDDGNTLNYARFDDPTWRPGPVPSSYNLSQDIASGTWAYTNAPPTEWAFCPGGNYLVQFAVRNYCDGWEAVEIKFTVENCSDPVIETVEQNCLSTLVRVKFSENWVNGMANFTASAPGQISAQYYHNGYYYAAVTSSMPGDVTVTFSAATACEPIMATATVLIKCDPVLPPVPPMNLEHVCNGEPELNCYDFSSLGCIAGFEVESSDPKLFADVNGTEICLISNWNMPYTAYLYVTPIGICGEIGETVEWKIYVNDPVHCEDGGIPLIVNTNNSNTGVSQSIDISKEKNNQLNNNDLDFELTIYPNPFTETLNINCSENRTGLLVKIFNATGRLVFETDQLNGTINTGQLMPGMYFTKILNGKGQVVHTGKVIKVN